MSNFAKIFEIEEFGQVVVMKDYENKHHCVNLFYKNCDNCNINGKITTLTFSFGLENKANSFFDGIYKEKIIRCINMSKPTKLFVSNEIPKTFDKEGYESINWTQIEDVLNK